MTDRDIQIVELTRSGMSARTIKCKLGLGLTVRSIQRVAENYVGPTSKVANSWANQLPIELRPHIIWCLEQLGLDPHTCAICKERQTKKCDIHHTKYEGATIYDLQYVCRSCNLARVNHGLI